jgi:hypothetical protein
VADIARAAAGERAGAEDNRRPPMAQKTLVAPNIYEVSGENTQITYSTTSADGSPQLSYTGPKGEKAEYSFSGDEIETLESALGTEVTVTLDDIADLHVITLTLLLPEMWVAPGAGQKFKTIAIYATKEEPITARIGFPAAREIYGTVELEGEGKLVEF